MEAENVREETPIVDAVDYEKLDIVKYLIGKKANLNCQGKPSALHTAKHSSMIKLLLENRADIEGRDDKGRTVLMYVCWRPGGSKEIAKILVEKQADLNARTGSGDTALSIAIEMERSEITDFLKQSGAKE